MLDKEKERRVGDLAHQVMTLAHNTLLIRMRFLDMAVGRMEAKPDTGFYMATNGENVYYDPVLVLKAYKEDKNAPTRDYLHTVLHCVFHHNFSEKKMDPLRWDLACDIAVEKVISGLNVTSLDCTRVWAQENATDVNRILKSIPAVTAENIYRYLLDHDNISDRDVVEMNKLFRGDDHWIWYDHSRDEDGDGNGKNDRNGVATQGGEGKDGNGDGSTHVKKKMMNGKDPFDKENASMRFDQSVMEAWKDITEHIQEDLETFSKSFGDAAGALLQNVRDVTKEKYDYTEFLKKFSVFHEAMKINDDEFDYNFYTYGLRLYGDMPLVEPLEYKDVKRIKEIAIVIDTSGSVMGEEVQSFLQKTYNILKNQESFFNKFNLHIIQCDAQVQEDRKITTQQEFDAYIKAMSFHGFGGTDFRPAFRYVDDLIEKKEFVNLKSGTIGRRSPFPRWHGARRPWPAGGGSIRPRGRSRIRPGTRFRRGRHTVSMGPSSR